jgi:hypothetical protein
MDASPAIDSGQRDRRFTSSQGLCSDWNIGIMERISIESAEAGKSSLMESRA